MSLVKMPQFTYVQKNTFVKETGKKIWGAKTEGIKEGDVRHGIILGFETFNQTKNIIIKCFEENGGTVAVAGCKSLSKQLHAEQDYPFINLIYNVGDVVAITFVDSFVANKGQAAGKLIARYKVREVQGYTLTEEDVADIRQFQAEQAKVTPIAQYAQIPAQPYQNQYAAPIQNPYSQRLQQQQFAAPQPVWNPPPVQDVPDFAPPPAKASFVKSKNDDTFDI